MIPASSPPDGALCASCLAQGWQAGTEVTLGLLKHTSVPKLSAIVALLPPCPEEGEELPAQRSPAIRPRITPAETLQFTV